MVLVNGKITPKKNKPAVKKKVKRKNNSRISVPVAKRRSDSFAKEARILIYILPFLLVGVFSTIYFVPDDFSVTGKAISAPTNSGNIEYVHVPSQAMSAKLLRGVKLFFESYWPFVLVGLVASLIIIGILLFVINYYNKNLRKENLDEVESYMKQEIRDGTNK